MARKNKLEKLLVLGATGQLGREICDAFADLEIVRPSHTDLPIEHHAALITTLERVKPSIVVNCTAFHQVDQCEADPQKAFLINASMVGAASDACAKRGIAFATISTDYVFSGDNGKIYDEADAVSPKNVYGISKVAGEFYARNANYRSFVFRTSGVFGKSGFSNKGPTFVERMISMAEAGQVPTVVDNIVFSPSYAVDVARAMREIIEREEGGVFHVTNDGHCSWYDLAVESIRAAGLEPNVLRATYFPEEGEIKRPMHSPLTSLRFTAGKYERPRTWQAAVADYVGQRSARLRDQV